MTLRQKQSIFAHLVSGLLLAASKFGYEVTLGEAYRSPEEAERLAKLGKGIKTSLHTSRLAIDLNLFLDGQLLTKSEDYKTLGEWWELNSTPDYQCCWGGRFNDGNHFSISHNGRR